MEQGFGNKNILHSEQRGWGEGSEDYSSGVQSGQSLLNYPPDKKPEKNKEEKFECKI